MKATSTARGSALLGLCLGALVVLALCPPAHWLASATHTLTQGRVSLLNARGTLWSGEAQLALSGGADSVDAASLPGTVRWSLRPSLSGLQLALRAECCTPDTVHIHITPRWGGAEVAFSNSVSHWPAALLSGLGTPWNTLSPDGRLTLRSDGLQLSVTGREIKLTGSAQLDIQDFTTRLSTLKPLGNYRVELSGGDVPSFSLRTTSGSLDLSGQGHWQDQRLRFEGRALAAPGKEDALSNLLNIIGRRQGAESIITLG